MDGGGTEVWDRIRDNWEAKESDWLINSKGGIAAGSVTVKQNENYAKERVS